MTKAYWIAHVRITDPGAYASYQALAPQAFTEHGARFLARATDAQTLEGDSWERHVVIEFPSREAALACYNSPPYRAARKARKGACRASITIVDALD